MGKPIIIGYDPGTTAALAILDTSGNILYLKSKKEFLRKEIVEEITKRGKPIIIASDKNSLSKNVEKLASSLGCKAFNPVEDLSNLEKYNIIKNYLDVVKNDHERDALASALKAHRSYSDLFKKTDKTISFLGLSEFYGEIVNALIQKEAKNINEAINFVLNDIRIKKEKFIENKKGQFEKITPKGKTPLVYSILQSSQDFINIRGGTVVLISDGIESCEGDIKSIASQLKGSGIELTVNIIGFDIKEEEARKQLETIAKSTGGIYLDAKDSQELLSSLQQTLKIEYVLIDEKGKVKASGYVGGEAVSISEGEYILQLKLEPTFLETKVEVSPAKISVFLLEKEEGKWAIKKQD